MIDIEYPPEVLQCLGRLFVLHCEHKVEEGLIVHLALESLVLLENAVDKYLGKPIGVISELMLFEHAVLILVELEVLIVDAET